MTLNDEMFSKLLTLSPEGKKEAVAAISDYTRAMMRTARPSQVQREIFLMASEDHAKMQAMSRFRQLRFVLGRIRKREKCD